MLVFVHEFGHYLAARWCGVHVEVFSIGFGQAITSWVDRHGTIWKIAWLPLGGYVKLHGQERPEDVSAEVRAGWIAGRTFHEKSVLSPRHRRRRRADRQLPARHGAVRRAVRQHGQAGHPAGGGEVLPGSAAAHAGLQANDRIDGIDGQPIHTFEDIQHIVTAHPDETLSLTVTRGGATSTVQAHTEAQEVRRPADRHAGHPRRHGRVPTTSAWAAALWGGVTQTWDVTAETIQGVAQMIAGTRGTEELGGPLRIAQLSGQVAELGLASLVSFIAVLSVNLGLINLFPIPVLDGGHLLFYLAEAIRGRPLPPRAQEYGFRAGPRGAGRPVHLRDLERPQHIGLFHWVAHLIG